MALGEFFGYLASLLVFMTFYMKTMVPLRMIAIGSNIAFMTYAIYDGLLPILILHSLLLPLNVLRLHQIKARVAMIAQSWKGSVSLDDLLPYMTQRRFHKGEVLFHNGDVSREMYFILDGEVRLEEIGKTLGAGELFGEIGMFSPDRQRTATAVCATDGTLLQIEDRKVLEIYHQNPSFGFYIVRLITGRLIENQMAIEGLAEGYAAAFEGLDLPRAAGDTPPVAAPAPARVKQLRAITNPYFLAAVAASAAVVIYAGWSAQSYVQSILFRGDAIVTTWIRTATSPIKGNLVSAALTPGQRVGGDGRIAIVRNEQADHSQVVHAQADVARARSKVEELETYLAQIKRLDAEFQARSEGYADNFMSLLAVEIDDDKQEIAHLDSQLKLLRVLADRKAVLAKRGDASKTAADTARAEVEGLARLRAQRQQTLAHAERRLSAAQKGVFLTGDGRVPEWVYRSQDALRLEIARTTRSLADARADLATARIDADAARQLFEKTSASPIVVPPGSIVWSVFAASGEAVDIKTRIVEWIDCRVLLVHVPISDIEVPLLHPGMSADVLVEGEAKPRKATVLMTRGTAATLGSNDLAAYPKDISADSGHAILSLESLPKDAKDCPVGHTAHADFADFDTLDLVRAWLRL